jgi:hypothetical protein
MPSVVRDPSQDPVAFTALVPDRRSSLAGEVTTVSDALAAPWVFAVRRRCCAPARTTCRRWFAGRIAGGVSPPMTSHARPPFTHAAFPFWGAARELILGQTPPGRFLQLRTTCGHCTGALDSSQGRGPRPPSFSDASRGSREREQRCAASRAASAERDLGAGSSRFPGFARPRYLARRATSDGSRRRSE